MVDVSALGTSRAAGGEPAVSVAAVTGRRWRATWVWKTAPPPQRGLLPEVPPERRQQPAAFRRTFDVAGAVRSAVPVHVTADSRYRLWVNGTAVGRGPVRSAPDVRHYDTYDIGPLLRPGRNVVSVLVRFYGEPTPWSLPVQPFADFGYGGLLLDCDVFDIGTDERWRCDDGPLSTTGPGFRVHGTRNEIWAAGGRAWLDAGFDDSGWRPAVPLRASSSPLPTGAGVPSSPFTVLRPRPIASLTTDRRQVEDHVVGRGMLERAPGAVDVDDIVALVGGGTATPAPPGGLLSATLLVPGEYVVVDAGGIVVGVPEVTVDAGGEGEVVVVVGEWLDEAGLPEVRPRGTATRFGVRGHEVLAPFEGLGFRYVGVINSGDAPVAVRSVAVVEERCPTVDVGRFYCDDDVLSRAYAAGRRTRQVCATDAYLDCPTREDRAWLGDAYVHLMIGLATDADRRMDEWALRLGAQRPRGDGLLPVVAGGDLDGYGDVIPDYSLHWVNALRELWWHTDDADRVKALVPRVHSILDWFDGYLGDDGLDAVPGWVFLDSHEKPEGVPLAPLHALLLKAWTSAAELGEVVGDAALSARVGGKRRAVLVDAFDRYWDEGRGAYLDAPPGDAPPMVSQRTQALAILADAAPRDRWPRMLSAAYESGPAWVHGGCPQQARGASLGFDTTPPSPGQVIGVSSFFAHLSHQALARAGRRDLLLASLARWKRFQDAGSDTTWEHWNPAGVLTSTCHAWSGTPAYDLPVHVLGIRPAAPGYREVEVRPWLGGLTRVAGAVPSPFGVIEAELTRTDGGGIRGSVVLPPGTSGTFVAEEHVHDPVALPSGRTEIAIDARAAHTTTQQERP